VFVFFEDGGAFGVGGFWPAVAAADEVGREAAVVVGVGFVIGHGQRVEELAGVERFAGCGAGLDVAGEEFELGGVVVFRGFPWAAVAGVAGHAEAEVVGLDGSVACAGFAEVAGFDEGEEAAGGVALVDERVDWDGELVFGGFGADAVEFFRVDGVGFAADVGGDAGFGHEVAFVGAVEEDGGVPDVACGGFEGDEALAVHGDGDEGFVAMDGDAGVFEHGGEDGGGGVGFEEPEGFAAGGGGERVGAAAMGFEVGGACFEAPCVGGFVELEDAFVEFAGDAAAGGFVAEVGGSEASGGVAADVVGWFDEGAGFAHADGLEGGGDACGGSAEDTDIGVGVAGGGETVPESQENERERGFHGRRRGVGRRVGKRKKLDGNTAGGERP